MKPTPRSILLAECIIAALSASPSAMAVPVVGVYQDDPTHCDNPGPITLSHELGPTAAGFPINEGLLVSVQLSTDPAHFSCVGDDGIFNEYSVRLTNVSGLQWTNLFFVADRFLAPGNFDGFADDAGFDGPASAASFRIDGTVTAGTNNPLVFEDMTADEILEVGESWTFLIDNWSDSAAPTFGSVGKFADSSAAGIDTQSTASILATPVPEPAALTLLFIASLALIMKGRSR